MVDLFTCGGIILDSVVAADGTVQPGSLGGNAAYSAAGARLWAKAGCVGVIPRNYPVQLLETLRTAGVDTSGLHAAEVDVAGSEWFFHRADGSRMDQLHGPTDLVPPGIRLLPAEALALQARLRARSSEDGFGAFRAAHPVEPHHVPAEFWRPGVGVHLAPNRMDAQHRLLRRARQDGAVVSMDPGRHADAMTDADLAAVLTGCDVFLPSEKELRSLVPGEAPERAVAALAGRGAAVVGKLGPAGCIVADPRSLALVAVPAYPTAAPDPTGAGDAFCGGFLAGLLRTKDPVLAACFGTVSASFAVEGFGPARLLAANAAEASFRLRWLAARVPAAQTLGLDAALPRELA